jgi:5'(3')-deoxyribonucleotidase
MVDTFDEQLKPGFSAPPVNKRKIQDDEYEQEKQKKEKAEKERASADELPIKKKQKTNEFRGPTIYLDMDGVLADFIGGVDKAHKKKFGTKMAWTDKRGGFNVKDDVNLIGSVKSNPTFWSNLAWTSNGKKLVNHVLKYKPGIVSAYMKDDLRSKKQKGEWLQKNIGINNLGDINIVRRKDKPLFARGEWGPNILIDDLELNIIKWRRAGGIGLLYNDKSYRKTIRELIKLGFE